MVVMERRFLLCVEKSSTRKWSKMFRSKSPVTTFKHPFISPASLIAILLVLILAACGGGSQPTTSTTPTNTVGSQSGAFGLAALPGYQISLFASQTGAFIGPD